MAGDWIKTRVWLCRDPKVIRMADYLAQQRPFMNWLTDPVRAGCKDSAYEHVTRNVTVALCVTGLIVTWGTARERGNREGDDLVLDCCELAEISAVADVPCFGEAMRHVGWAIEREDDCVVFPKFFREQESPDDKHRRQNAERQATFRKNRTIEQGNGSNAKVTLASNVTVTTEKRREEIKTSALPDWIPVEAWNAFLDMRKKIRKPPTDRAIELAIAKLAKLRDEGHDPGAVLEQSVMNSWQDLFPPRAGSQPQKRQVAM